jgi:hypothetical protein
VLTVRGTKHGRTVRRGRRCGPARAAGQWPGGAGPAARQRIAGERGFTVFELLMAASIGTVILLAAYGLLDSTVRAFGTSGQRTDVAQRGRLTMDETTRRLRSPVCLEANGTSAVLDATSTSIRFWSDLTGSDFRTGNPQPVVRELTVTGGVLNEAVRNTPSGTITSRRELGTRLGQVGGAPHFRYYALEPVKSPPAPRQANVALGSPVAAGDLRRIARVTVAFRVAAGNGDPKLAADFESDVYIRSIDQSEPMGAIRCSA